MQLYHFTDLWSLDEGGTILREGLRPAADQGEWPLPPFEPVVWLTSEAECTFFEAPPEVRITVVIPSTDRRLARWETWLRKHGEQKVIAACYKAMSNGWSNGAWRSFYCYFGTVGLNRIRRVEYVDSGNEPGETG